MNMIDDFFSFSFIDVRYNALVLCLLPLSYTNDRLKELSTASTSRDRAIECLKRAGIDNYKVSVTCRFSSIERSYFSCHKKRRKKERDLII